MLEDSFGIKELQGGEGVYMYKGKKHHKSAFKYEWPIQFLHTQPTVITDLGSFDGGDSLRFSLWFPTARIITLEACVENYKRIVNKNIPRAEVFNYAIFNYDGTIKFHPAVLNDSIDRTDSMGSVFEVTDQYRSNWPNVQFKEPVDVLCHTFDTLCEKLGITHVDIAHIDVEGASVQAVAGMNKVLPLMVYIEKSNSFLFKNDSGRNDTLDIVMQEKGYKKQIELTNDILYVRRYLVI